MWVERRFEGDRQARIKLDAAPWSLRSSPAAAASRRSGWRSACGPASPSSPTSRRRASLAAEVLGFALGPWETFWILFYGLATYGNAGYLREQVCKYMCPYARFQSAMFDRDTLIISYDPLRGEPRGSRKRGVDPASIGKGDCIDCTLCVQVCPTGIDIRKGLQYECIGCAACIDVCNGVMDKMAYAARPDPLRHPERDGRTLVAPRRCGSASRGRGFSSTAPSCAPLAARLRRQPGDCARRSRPTSSATAARWRGWSRAGASRTSTGCS